MTRKVYAVLSAQDKQRLAQRLERNIAHQDNGCIKWATKKFSHQYGVFKLVNIVEPAQAPVKVTEVI
jgi:hypothetical protein